MVQRDTTRRRMLVLGGLVLVLTVALPMITVQHDDFDLRIYHGAVRYWVREGGMIYDWLQLNQKYGFTYPPFAAVLMAPMALIPLKVMSAALAVATTVASATLLWWLLAGLITRRGWSPWFVMLVAAGLATAFEPLAETFTFGQINLLLLFIVACDVLLFQARGSRWAGVGIGVATAIKLTPGVFIVYLLVTRQWRAAFVAMGTATGVTLGAAAIDPAASREFWTAAIWNTDRVGDISFVSNQSLQGLVARWSPAHPNRIAWLVLVLAVLVFWAWKSNNAVKAGDHATGLALTGIVGCLVSPITWIHHLVWMLPAIVLMIVAAHTAEPATRRRQWQLLVGWGTYLLFTTRLPWLWRYHVTGEMALVFGSAYVWAGMALLVLVPIRSGVPASPAEAPVDRREAAEPVAA